MVSIYVAYSSLEIVANSDRWYGFEFDFNQEATFVRDPVIDLN